MPEEIGSSLDYLSEVSKTKYGDLEIISGTWVGNFKKNNLYVSFAWSGWGKVSAARAATRIISFEFNNLPIEFLIFTGVAGAIDSNLKQWDIVIASELIQHDMDARPLFDKYVIPSLNLKRIKANQKLLDLTYKYISEGLNNGLHEMFGSVHKGLIATGDQFISKKESANKLSEDIKQLLAVEMEGAAVAQVAIQEKIPCQIIRVISDEADSSSPSDFVQFMEKYIKSSAKLVKILLDNFN